MRNARRLVVALVLTACDGDPGPQRDAGIDTLRPDAEVSPSCVPSGSCATGPECVRGGVLMCCGQGERCVAGECMCGTSGALCGPGDTCEAAGPLGSDQCGSVCCGTSGPCPQ